MKRERFLTQQQRYRPVTLLKDFSDEEMVKDWTLSELDKRPAGRGLTFVPGNV